MLSKSVKQKPQGFKPKKRKQRDLKRTYEWYSKKDWPLGYRTRLLARALYGDAPRRQGGAA